MSDNKVSHGRANDVIKMMADREVKLDDLRRLHAVNQELLEALKAVMELPIHIAIGAPGEAAIVQAARAVIAKAEQEMKP